MNTLQVFVYNEDGSMDASSERMDSSSVIISCGIGKKVVAAVVNAPEISPEDVRTLDRLKAVPSSLTDNRPGGFVMFGMETITLSARATVKVPVKRLVSKIVLSQIDRDFDDPVAAAKPLIIKGVSLKHVAGSYTLGGVAPAEVVWYNDVQNEKIEEPESVKNLIADYGLDFPLVQSGSYETPHCFYSYPNDAGSKVTILSVETLFSGMVAYYPIALKALEPNKIYILTNLKLTRQGGAFDDEDTIIFDIKVEDWETGAEWEEIY